MVDKLEQIFEAYLIATGKNPTDGSIRLGIESDWLCSKAKGYLNIDNTGLLSILTMIEAYKSFIKEKELAEHKKMLNTLDPFLYIIQHFNMAVKAMNNNSNIDTIKKGMEIIQMQFESAFDKLHLTKIETVGKKFNPVLHDAATKEYSDTIEQGYITQEWTAGYTYEDKVLKPAGVVVSMGKEPTE